MGGIPSKTSSHTISSVLSPITQVSLPWPFALVIYLISKELQSYMYMNLLNSQQGKAPLSDALKLFYHYIMYWKNWLYRGNKFTGKPAVFILTHKVMNPNWPELNQLTLYKHELHVGRNMTSWPSALMWSTQTFQPTCACIQPYIHLEDFISWECMYALKIINHNIGMSHVQCRLSYWYRDDFFRLHVKIRGPTIHCKCTCIVRSVRLTKCTRH